MCITLFLHSHFLSFFFLSFKLTLISPSFQSFLPFLLTSFSILYTYTRTLHGKRERPRQKSECERERERERERIVLFGREEREKVNFLKTSSSWDQLFRSISICGPIKLKWICGPIELKFCKNVHDTWISNMNDGDRISRTL